MMTSMMNKTEFGNVVEAVRTENNGSYDQMVPMIDVEFSSANRVRIGNYENIPVLDSALSLFTTRNRIPQAYIERLPSYLQAENLNHWVEQERNHEMMFRFNNRGQLRAIFTKRYKPVDNVDVVNSLVRNGVRDDAEVEFRMDNNGMVLNLLDANSGFSIGGDNDFVNGISVINSEVGRSALRFAGYVMRMICTNGMVSMLPSEISRFRHINNDIKENFDIVWNQVQQARPNSEDNAKRWKISLDSVVDSPDETFGELNRRYQLNEDERTAVDWGFHQEPGDRMFHVINAYTKASQSRAVSSEEAYKLQEVGGKILATLN